MAVTGLPTNSGVSILSGELKENVKRFCLFGTSSSSSDVPFNENSSLSSLSVYLIGKFDIARSYFDDNGTLTFECPIPYDFSDTKWVGAAGLIFNDGSSEVLVAVSSMPKFQKTAGIGGTVHYKVPIAGESGTVVFEAMPYTTRPELDSVLNELFAGLGSAMDQAGMANKELEKTLNIRNQTGQVKVYNRGVVKGCEASRSADAVRNLSVSAGEFFMKGRVFSLPEMLNTASVPQNSTGQNQECCLYLWVDDAGGFQIDCSALGEEPPEGAVVLYRVTVPANSTEATDPYLSGCGLIDIRNIEPEYPDLYNLNAVYVPLKTGLPDNDYGVQIEVVGFTGSGLYEVSTGSKAGNGFQVNIDALADEVELRWSVEKNNL
jgi:hypothetical protein